MGFAEKLKKLRDQKGISQLELSEKIGVSPSSITMYEQGERVPRDSVKIKIADYFGVTVESIFFDTRQHIEWCY